MIRLTHPSWFRVMSTACSAGVLVACGCAKNGASAPGGATPPAHAGSESSATGRGATEGATARVDAMGGEHPQIAWMISVMEVDRPVVVAPDGSIMVAADPARAAAASRTFAPGGERKVFASVNRVPGHRLVSAPSIVSTPGATAEISIGTLDESRSSTGDFSSRVLGIVNGESLVVDVECLRGIGAGKSVWSQLRGVSVPKGGGLVLVGPLGTNAASVDPKTKAMAWVPQWGVVVIRPSILRSVDDHPAQTSSGMAGE